MTAARRSAARHAATRRERQVGVDEADEHAFGAARGGVWSKVSRSSPVSEVTWPLSPSVAPERPVVDDVHLDHRAHERALGELVAHARHGRGSSGCGRPGPAGWPRSRGARSTVPAVVVHGDAPLATGRSGAPGRRAGPGPRAGRPGAATSCWAPRGDPGLLRAVDDADHLLRRRRRSAGRTARAATRSRRARRGTARGSAAAATPSRRRSTAGRRSRISSVVASSGAASGCAHGVGRVELHRARGHLDHRVDQVRGLHRVAGRDRAAVAEQRAAGQLQVVAVGVLRERLETELARSGRAPGPGSGRPTGRRTRSAGRRPRRPSGSGRRRGRAPRARRRRAPRQSARGRRTGRPGRLRRRRRRRGLASR